MRQTKILTLSFVLLSVLSCSKPDKGSGMESFTDFDGWYISSSSASFGNSVFKTITPEVAKIHVVEQQDGTIGITCFYEWLKTSLQFDLKGVPVLKEKAGFRMNATNVPGSISIGKEHADCDFTISGTISSPQEGVASAAVSLSGAFREEAVSLEIMELRKAYDVAAFPPPSYVTIDYVDLHNVFKNALDEKVSLVLQGVSIQDKAQFDILPHPSVRFGDSDWLWPSLAECQTLTISRASGQSVTFARGEGFLSNSQTVYTEEQSTHHSIEYGVLYTFSSTIRTYVIDDNIFTADGVAYRPMSASAPAPETP